MAGLMKVLAAAALILPLWAAPAGAEDLSDPTRPSTGRPPPVEAPAAVAARWRLHSTLISEGRRTAVINEQVVGVGETIDGATVVEILPWAVRMRTASGPVELTLSGHNLDLKTR